MFLNRTKIKLFLYPFIIILLLSSCGKNSSFLPGADARKVPVNAKDRMQKNLEEGKGFRLNEVVKGSKGGGSFEFATSNELWRASLDTIDFIPLASANYSGGILITDWYSDGNNLNESIKINIRFLSNEVRSDALDISIFYKSCNENQNCIVEKRDTELRQELVKEILKKATLYKQNLQEQNFKPYPKIK